MLTRAQEKVSSTASSLVQYWWYQRLQSHPTHSVVGILEGSMSVGSTGSYCLQMAHTHVSTLPMSWKPVGVEEDEEEAPPPLEPPRLRSRPPPLLAPPPARRETPSSPRPAGVALPWPPILNKLLPDVEVLVAGEAAPPAVAAAADLRFEPGSILVVL